MKNFCIIGKPVSHSLSPKIFKYLFNFFNINAEYNSVLLNTNKEFVDFIKNNIDLYNGYNITSPYKKIAFDNVNQLDDLALELSAVNCINIHNSQLIGCNTDYNGFINMISLNNINLNNKKVIVLGYGGVAKTIIVSLLKEYNCDIFVYGRNFDKINNVINEVQTKYKSKTLSLYNHNITNNFILINCLPLKIDSKNLDSLLSYLPVSNIDMCLDINYIESNFSLEINKYCQIISGIDMLIYQALKSFDIWFNCNCLEKINYLDLKRSIL